MNKQQRDNVALRVVKFYNLNNNDSSKTYKHFTEEKISKSTIKRILSRYRSTGTYATKSPSGRPMKQKNKIAMNKVKKLIQDRPNISIRKGSAKTKIPKSTFQWLAQKKLGFKTYKQQTVPKYINDQEKRAKKGCMKLYEKLHDDVVLIIDDETYVQQDNEQVNIKQYYRAKNKNDVNDKYRFKAKQKFPKKFLVWQALDDKGHASDLFICEGTMNADLYLNECIKKRLIPFIKKWHSNSNVLFWPDLAQAHYAKRVTDFLDEQKINYVSKKDNPPNVPQARPIEQYWAICKRKYAEKNVQSNTLSNFKSIWKKIANEVIQESGKQLMESTKKKLRLIGRNGVLETFKK